MHGGDAPQVRAAREARIVAMGAALEAPKSMQDAASILVDTMGSAHAVRVHLQEQIASGRLTSAELTTGLRALGDWMDRAGRLSKVVLDAGVEERRVQLAEEQGRIVGEVIHRILDGMLAGVVAALAEDAVAARLVEQRWGPLMREVAPEQLRALGPGAAG